MTYDPITRATPTYINARRLGAHDGEAWGMPTHRIESRNTSAEWSYGFFGLLRMIPSFTIMALPIVVVTKLAGWW